MLNLQFSKWLENSLIFIIFSSMKKLVMFLAVAGIFASCKPETIETAFDVNPAEATITVTVVDVNTAQPVPAEEYTLTASAGTVNGNVVTLKGDKALAETEVTISANYEGTDYAAPSPVKVNALRAGGKASYGATIVVGSPVSDKEITIAPDENSIEGYYAELFLTPDATGHYGHSVDHDFTHDGISNWVQNLTEFMLELTVDYTNMYGAMYDASAVNYVDPNYKNVVDAYATLFGDLSYYYEEPDTYTGQVSAWAYYTVKQTVYYITYNLCVYADGVVVGEIPATEISNNIEYIEIANPYGHGHYEHGHGVHGDNANAGGGIVFGE